MTATLDYHTPSGEGAVSCCGRDSRRHRADVLREHRRDDPDSAVASAPRMIVTVTPPTSSHRDGPIITQRDARPEPDRHRTRRSTPATISVPTRPTM